MSSVRCPICDAPMPGDWSEYPDYPFCTKRCRTIDLGRWLSEDYKVSAGPADDLSSPKSDDEE
ncbi:MAG: DNA gyrase inhibitor YacG [Fimbriiglobus sp.]|nr:DNA gyrase inhibitor YacG [Fimbriiglobus sp.]